MQIEQQQERCCTDCEEAEWVAHVAFFMEVVDQEVMSAINDVIHAAGARAELARGAIAACLLRDLALSGVGTCHLELLARTIGQAAQETHERA